MHSLEKRVALDACLQYDDKDSLFALALGPTATVLAYDLSLQGYQALDLGHIVKSYDLYCKNNKRVDLTPEERAKFFAKD